MIKKLWYGVHYIGLLIWCFFSLLLGGLWGGLAFALALVAVPLWEMWDEKKPQGITFYWFDERGIKVREEKAPVLVQWFFTSEGKSDKWDIFWGYAGAVTAVAIIILWF